jgi:2-hydroxy-3-keto-5-methylthiopentenyl-1-phosphate phosphatase
MILLSSGMEPIIRALLAKLIGPKAQGIPILSNNVETSPDGSWNIVFRDESRKFSTSYFCLTKTSDMTSLEQLGRMHLFLRMAARFSYIAVMGCPTSAQQEKRTFCLPKRGKI